MHYSYLAVIQGFCLKRSILHFQQEKRNKSKGQQGRYHQKVDVKSSQMKKKILFGELQDKIARDQVCNNYSISVNFVGDEK